MRRVPCSTHREEDTMDDDGFKSLADRLRHTEQQVHAELSAGATLLARGKRRERALQALRQLCAGPAPGLPTAEVPDTFFIGRTPGPEVARRMLGARYRGFWARVLVEDADRRVAAEADGRLGTLGECVEVPCEYCTAAAPVIGMDPPLAIDAGGVTVTCRLFVLCIGCPRVAELGDIGLRADIESSLGRHDPRLLGAARERAHG